MLIACLIGILLAVVTVVLFATWVEARWRRSPDRIAQLVEVAVRQAIGPSDPRLQPSSPGATRAVMVLAVDISDGLNARYKVSVVEAEGLAQHIVVEILDQVTPLSTLAI